MAFIDEQFERIVSTRNALQLAQRFEALSIPDLNIEEQYARILQHYAADLEQVASIYQGTKAHPEVARDLPSIAGRNCVITFA
jgi:hypothetical protein